MAKKIGYTYVRFSTKDQEAGNSLRRQTEGAERYARAHGITLDDTRLISDLGLSAFSGAHKKRGGLGLFLDGIQSGKVKSGEIIIVEALDRLSREHTLDAYDLVSKIIRAGIEIHSTEDEQIYTWKTLDEGAAAILSGKLEQARQFSKRLSRRVTSAWMAKKETGTALTKRCPGWLRIIDGEYAVIPERAELVKRIFNESANGIGQSAIVRRLNEEGIPTFDMSGQGIKVKKKKKTAWQASYVQKVIHNRAVMGLYQPKTKRVDDGVERLLYPPIIDAELFERALAARAARITRAGGRRGNHYRNILQGVCACGVCFGTMIYLNKGRRSPHLPLSQYLMCNSNRRGMGCENGAIFRYDFVEKAVLDIVCQFHLLNPALFKANDPQVHNIAKEIADARQAQELRQREINHIMESFAGKPGRNGAARIMVLEAEMDDAEQNIKGLTQQLALARGESRMSHFDRIIQTRKQAESDGDQKYESRAILHQALKGVIEHITFIPESGSAHVVLKGYLMTFTVTASGTTETLSFHNGGMSIHFVDGHFTKPAPSNDFIMAAQGRRPDESNQLLVNLQGLTPEQASKALERVDS